MYLKRISKGILRISGIHIWIASLVPMIVAIMLAYTRNQAFSLKWWALSMVGVMLIETGKHCINDLVDYKSGVDLSVAPDHLTPYSGGKKVLTENLLTVKETKTIGQITLTVAVFIGIYIAIYRAPIIWIIGIVGVFLAIAYSLPPFAFCYRGLGEIAVGLTYGPLIFLGTYVTMTGHIDAMAVLSSIPIGLLVTNILWINQYPDNEADKMNGKKNWVVRLGKKRGLKIYKGIYLLLYLFFIIIALATKNLYWLINLISIPMAYQSYKNAAKSYDNISKLVKSNQLTAKLYLVVGMTMIATFVLTYLV